MPNNQKQETPIQTSLVLIILILAVFGIGMMIVREGKNPSHSSITSFARP